jgi:hypothetical protein
MSDINKRTQINTTTLPTFERFVLDTDGSEDTLHIFAKDGSTLMGTARRLPSYRGYVRSQWHITGFSRYGSYIFDFEQIEQIVNKYIDDSADVDDTDWIFGSDED